MSYDNAGGREVRCRGYPPLFQECGDAVFFEEGEESRGASHLFEAGATETGDWGFEGFGGYVVHGIWY